MALPARQVSLCCTNYHTLTLRHPAEWSCAASSLAERYIVPFQDFVLRPFLRSVKQAYIDSKNKVSWIPLFLPNYTGQQMQRRLYHQRTSSFRDTPFLLCLFGKHENKEIWYYILSLHIWHRFMDTHFAALMVGTLYQAHSRALQITKQVTDSWIDEVLPKKFGPTRFIYHANRIVIVLVTKRILSQVTRNLRRRSPTIQGYSKETRNSITKQHTSLFVDFG